MGWTWYRATHYYPNGGIDRRAECDAYFMEGLNRGHYDVLKSTMVGKVYYAAVKKLKKYDGCDEKGEWIYSDLPPEEQKVFGAVFITSTLMKDYFNFGYKDMDESMGPGDCDCPKSIIALLSETDNLYALHWRQKCLERCNGKPSLGKLPIGTVIEFYLIKNIIATLFQLVFIGIFLRQINHSDTRYTCQNLISELF